MWKALVGFLLVAVISLVAVAADTDCTCLSASPTGTRAELISEHVIGGLPALTDSAHQEILVRNAYVACYNSKAAIPEWVAYHVTADYLNTPDCEGEYDDFHEDPDLAESVKPSEYDGWFTQRGYDRGHLAPYAIAGGDRDADESYALYPFTSTGNDLEDASVGCLLLHVGWPLLHAVGLSKNVALQDLTPRLPPRLG